MYPKLRMNNRPAKALKIAMSYPPPEITVGDDLYGIYISCGRAGGG